MTGAISAPASRTSTRRDRFPYARFHADLIAQPPRWPQATDRLTSLRLELAYRTRSLVLRQIQPIQHLTLEIIDYPGEWLLDLPLLEQGYRPVLAATPWPWPSSRCAGRPPPRGSSGLVRLDIDGPEDEAGDHRRGRCLPPLPVHCHARARPQPGPARPVHQSRRPRRLGAAALLPAAARRAAARHQPGAHGRALRALPRGGGAAVLRRPFQPLRPADRAGRPARRAQRRAGPFRRHPGDAGADHEELPLRQPAACSAGCSRRGSTGCCSPSARPTTSRRTSMRRSSSCSS